MPRRQTGATDIGRRHRRACFELAFPNSQQQRDSAEDELDRFERHLGGMTQKARADLADTGIAGTTLYYRFSFAVARWLAKTVPGQVSIDWDAIDDEERVEDLLRQLLLPVEDEYFDSGYASCEDWVRIASTGFAGTDFDWLMAELDDNRLRRYWGQLYDAADLPLAWDLSGGRFSKTRNRLVIDDVAIRERELRKRPLHVKKEIQRPVTAIRRLAGRDGRKLVDTAIASLAARHREAEHFNHANPDEVYVASVGRGVEIAVFGLLPAYRYPIECTMGFLILSNGVPIGYGGASTLFRQVNTGINLFDEYRGSEASYLWVQVMRVYHTLFGCTRFIANPYQLGWENDEALHSGAFWFYYKLGYRPVEPRIRKLAHKESDRRRKNRSFRSTAETLRRLAASDMHLVLPGSSSRDFFHEYWLATSSELATRALRSLDAKSGADAARQLAEEVARQLRIRNLSSWTASERRSYVALAPLVAVAKPAGWNAHDKMAMRELLRAKGGDAERQYARTLAKHDRFREDLSAVCRRAER